MRGKIKNILIAFLSILFVLISFCEAQKTKKFYSMPSISPLYSPPPVQFRDNKLVLILFKTTPEVLQEMVPEPLVPNPGNLMFIYVGELNIENPVAGKYSYLESGIGVPVTFSKKPGNFAVYLYLDKALPIVGGREIWGWPKKDARINFEIQDKNISAKLERFGTTIITVAATQQKKVDPAPVQPELPWFNLKIIPSVMKNSPPEVMQLTTTKNRDSKTKEFFTCQASVQFGSSPMDPLEKIKIVEIVSAQFMITDFVMDFGEILYDYLAESQK